MPAQNSNQSFTIADNSDEVISVDNNDNNRAALNSNQAGNAADQTAAAGNQANQQAKNQVNNNVAQQASQTNNAPQAAAPASPAPAASSPEISSPNAPLSDTASSASPDAKAVNTTDDPTNIDNTADTNAASTVSDADAADSTDAVGQTLTGEQKIETNFTGLLGVLVENQIISEEQAQEINGVHLASKKSIEDIVRESEIVSELDLTKAKAELNQIPYVAVSETGIAPEALSRIDESVAKRYTLLPFAIDQAEKKLKVAMADPLNISAISFLEQKTGFKVESYYSTPSELKRLISARYAQDLSGDVTAALEETDTIDSGDLDMMQGQKGGFVKAAPINKIVNTVLDYALQSRASDVHIEPMAGKTRVRYRIDGILHEKLILPKSVHNAVVSRIKILADLKIDEKRVPQDGRFDYAVGSQEVDLRVSTMPSVHGEKVVMRLLMKNEAVPGLEELGMRGLALQRVNNAIRIPQGIFLVTGPTGSGKTTSLYSILNNINSPKVNIMTLEDPVEYQMSGVTQVQVRPQAGLTFANGLRSFLRQDPDIIMVGEIRDTETAELAVQASLTGHLVFATLHTNSAAGALPRLMDMKVEPFLLSSSMILVMAQRVIRKINPNYREEYQPDKEVITDIKQVLGDYFDDWCEKNSKNPQEITLFRPKKDRPQTEPEYLGRTGIFEVLIITDQIKSLINKAAPAEELEKAALKNGMMLMKQDGYIKALEGITTIEEVLRVAEVR